MIWIAREGPTLVGQYATMPVRLQVHGQELDASWGMDVMVAPERQRQGIGEVLFRTWDRNVGASLGLGLSDSSHRLFRKLRWPEPGPIPCLVKPLTRRALKRPQWPEPVNQARVGGHAAALCGSWHVRDRCGPRVESIRRFAPEFTTLWERLAPRFEFAVRRDAAYLNWKYRRGAARPLRPSPPCGATASCTGYAVYRHLQEPRGRVDEPGRLPRRPRRRGGAEDAAALGGPGSARGRLGQDPHVLPARRVPARASALGLLRREVDDGVHREGERADAAAGFYADNRSRWHVTLGDSDQDR